MRNISTVVLYIFFFLAISITLHSGFAFASQNIQDGCLACHEGGSLIVPDTMQFFYGTPFHNDHVIYAIAVSEEDEDCFQCHDPIVFSDPIPVGIGSEGNGCGNCHNTECEWEYLHESNQTYLDNVVGQTCYQCHSQCAQDFDSDSMPDVLDNCLQTPNGQDSGTCTSGNIGDPCTAPGINIPECGALGYCSMNQEDSYPPSGNECGDACECEGNFDNDVDVDGTDTNTFLVDLGRFLYNNPCEALDPCNGDFDCDGDVDGADTTKFLEDLGRFTYNKPCPQNCQTGDWCGYTP